MIDDRDYFPHIQPERTRNILQSMQDGVVTTDEAGNIDYLNPAAADLTGIQIQDALGRPADEVVVLLPEGSALPVKTPVASFIKSGGLDHPLAEYLQLILKAKDGRETGVSLNLSSVLDQNRGFRGAVLVLRDITRDIQRQKEILYLSYHDELTGLYNRRFFEENLKRLDTERQHPLSVIIGDINGLKIFNDVFGHLEGDRLLQTAAGIFRRTCRSEDLIARWGGDEFVILLPLTDPDTAGRICSRIREECSKEFEKDLKISISLGHATKTGAKTDTENLIKTAEDRMYKQKLLESQSLKDTIINSMRLLLQERNVETEEHTDRVRFISRRIGEELKLNGTQMKQLDQLALLHDIGKIAVNGTILFKTGHLTREEWEEMRKHPETGYRIARFSPELSQIAEYILTHHERWDGTGYPRKLRITDIPLLSRIIAVADAYDTMMNDQPYRKAMDQKQAVSEILDNAGTQFDPEIVRIFMEKVLNTPLKN
ncbi:MAG TPA: GGDEF domain-containing protein [Clostridiales bacterium]|nr:GGDEF domain-containing protein [Clostridiales bacterium]